ncbi:MAG TPA: ScpA family protein [Candidatus Nanoarchaeia archaeon]|nr:ScpA family protein [Candidatus Nanoarchaeia archaeon]
MEERIFDIIFKEDEVTWQTLLMDLVKSEGMDPWDIDISEISAKYIGMLKKMQEMDLRISGKVVLSAAILLKFKSNYFLNEEMNNFDKLMHPEEYAEDALYEDHPERPMPSYNKDDARLIPKTPQPRKRKVSIYDLVEALKQALEVKRRRKQILDVIQLPAPTKKVDISKVIEDLHAQISMFLEDADSLTFHELVPSGKKEDMIGLFLPLLHLSNGRKIDLAQQVHFGDIEITMPRPEEEKRTGSATNEVAQLDKAHDFIGDALDESEKPRKK